METLQSFWLGIIQGITEFLPISSSAHLILTPALTAVAKLLDVAMDSVSPDWTAFLIGELTSFAMALTAIHFS